MGTNDQMFQNTLATNQQDPAGQCDSLDLQSIYNAIGLISMAPLQ